MATAISATQRALCLPELLSTVFMFLQLPDPYDTIPVVDPHTGKHSDWGRDRFLLSCILVNKFWYREAVPYLWKECCQYPYSQPLKYYFAFIAPPRRQFYAAFVKHAILQGRRRVDDPSCPLNGLVFSRLKSMYCHYNICDYYLPRIKASRLKALEINTEFDVNPDSFVRAGQMEDMMEHVVDVFPDLEELKFLEMAEITPDIVRMLRERLPKLKVLDYEYCRMVDGPDAMDW